MRKRIAATVVAASALSGGVIGLTLFGPSTVGAKSGATSTTVQPATPQAAAGTADLKGDHHGHGFGGPGFGGPGFGDPGFGGRHGLVDGKAAVAKAIGISETELTTQLRSGKTIAQIAKAHGVTTQKVIDALVTDAKAKLAAAVKAGRLTQAQADRLQTGLTKGITNLVNGTFPKRPFGDHRGPGFGPLHD